MLSSCFRSTLPLFLFLNATFAFNYRLIIATREGAWVRGWGEGGRSGPVQLFGTLIRLKEAARAPPSAPSGARRLAAVVACLGDTGGGTSWPISPALASHQCRTRSGGWGERERASERESERVRERASERESRSRCTSDGGPRRR